MTEPDSGINTTTVTAGTLVADLNWNWEESHPRYVRQVQYPDGRIELQGGYAFGSASGQGIHWRALPVIQVDEQGDVR